MAGKSSKTPMTGGDLVNFFKQPDDLIFSFIDEGLEFQSLDSSIISYSSGEILMDDEGDENVINSTEENKVFWALQAELLQTTLGRTTSFESRVRKATKEALREMNSTGVNCSCRKMVADDSCRKCTLKGISESLKSAGFSCSICKSKWKSSPGMPSGEHTYMEVVQNSSSKKGELMEVIIELNFRGQFEMARANEEYNRMVKQLPEVYVGKIERLRNLIKILCCASKKCMKEKKMHMAPWRKHKYMQAKYLGSPEVMPEPFFPVNINNFQPLPRPRASMLTFDLLDSLPPEVGLFSTAIKVV